MNTIEIKLTKRKNKFILHILAIMMCTFGVLGFISELVTKGFSWWIAAGALLFVFGFLLLGSRMFIYVTSNEVKLVIESDGKTMLFYNQTDSGKIFNKSEDINLAKMGRFYIVKKRTRYLMNNYSYAFEGKGSKTSLFKEEIDAFPSLFEASENDRSKVLEFVKTVAPEIELGFQNVWEKLYEKKK
jgi:hypothetical protein